MKKLLHTTLSSLTTYTIQTFIQRAAAILLVLQCVNASAQNNVGIGTTTPNSKAILELKATDKGFIAPRMTGTQMNAIAVTATESALLIYNTDSLCYHFYNGTVWKNLCDKSIDTAVLNKAIKKYLNSNATTIINILKGDTALFNYTTINNAVINILTVDTSITNVAIINNATINILKVDTSTTNVAIINQANINNAIIDSSKTNYADINILKADTANLNVLNVGGQNIMNTISDSIASQAWLLKGNLGTNPPNSFIGTKDAKDLVFKTNNNERVRIASGTGNVGIGQTLPAEKLDVLGNIKFTGTLNPAGLPGNNNEVLTSTGNTTAPVWKPLTNIFNTNTTTNINVVNIDSSKTNYANINNAVIDSSITNYANINNAVIDSSKTNYANINNAVIDSSITNYANINNAVIDSSKTNYADINILKGDSATLNYLSVGGQNIMQTMTDSIKSQAWLLKGNAGTNPGVNFIGTTDNKDLVFKTNSIEVARFQTNGIFANQNPFINTIGTDNQGVTPNSLLWTNNGGGFNTALYNGGAANYSNGLLVKTLSTSALTTILDLSTGVQTPGGTSVMSVKGNGNVGLGTNNPLAQLHLLKDNSGGLGANLIIENRALVEAVGAQVNIDLACDNTGPAVPNGRIYSRLAELPSRASEMGFQTWNGGALQDRILIDKTGNVGIGTQTPTYKLHVVGGVATIEKDDVGGVLGTLNLRGKNASAAQPNSRMWTLYNMNEYATNHSGLEFWEYYDANNNGIYCDDGPNNCDARMIIKNGGNVGIGTSIPQTALNVMGNIQVGQTTSSVCNSILLATNVDYLGSPKGATTHSIFGPYNAALGSVGAMYIGVGKSTDGSLNDLIMYGTGGFNIRTTMIASNQTGISTFSPGYTLDINGTVGSFSGYTTYSDKYYKKDIQSLAPTLNNVLKLKPVTYLLNYDADTTVAKVVNKDYSRQVGLIAQETKEVFPLIVSTNTNGKLGIDYSKLGPILVQAMQELNAKVEAKTSQTIDNQKIIALEQELRLINEKHAQEMQLLLKRIENLEKKK
jgi:hypothetical protein